MAYGDARGALLLLLYPSQEVKVQLFLGRVLGRVWLGQEFKGTYIWIRESF